jgi:hypothetical protein
LKFNRDFFPGCDGGWDLPGQPHLEGLFDRFKFVLPGENPEMSSGKGVEGEFRVAICSRELAIVSDLNILP